MNTEYNIGDLIQMKGYEGAISIGVIVGTKMNGYSVDIQWLDKGYLSQGYSTHYLESCAVVVNCGPIQNL